VPKSIASPLSDFKSGSISLQFSGTEFKVRGLRKRKLQVKRNPKNQAAAGNHRGVSHRALQILTLAQVRTRKFYEEPRS
jgi:hypothetical protein